MCIYITRGEEKRKEKKRNNLDFSTFSIPTGDRRSRSTIVVVVVVVEKGPSVQDETDCWQEEISRAEKN